MRSTKSRSSDCAGWDTVGGMSTGGSEGEPLEPAGPDPKRHVETMDAMAFALGLIRGGDLEAAGLLLRDLLADGGPAAELPAVHAAYTAVLSAGDELAAARRHYERALAEMPGNNEWRTNLGGVLARSGDADGAIAQYRLALRSPPVLAETHLNLALALASRGETEPALEQFAAAARLSPSLAEAWLAWAGALKDARRFDEALEVYERGLTHAPGHRELRHRRAGLLLALRRPGDALTEFERLAQDDPRDGRAMAGLGEALRLVGSESRAESTLRRAVELDPQNVLAWLSLSSLAAGRGDREAALDAASRAHAAALQQGNTLFAGRAQQRIAELRAAGSAP